MIWSTRSLHQNSSAAVTAYIEATKRKTEIDRLTTTKEK